MKRAAIFVFFIFSLQIAVSQEFEMIRHQVKLGETVRMISKKYKIEPSEIYKLNKFAVDGISQGMVLQLMVPKKEEVAETPPPDNPDTSNTTTDQAQSTQSDETVNSSTTTTRTVTTVKRRKITDEGTTPTPDQSPEEIQNREEKTGHSVSHTVAKGETLFSIAKRYGVSVEEIKAQNAVLQHKGLQTGQHLVIPANHDGDIVEKLPDNVVGNSRPQNENNVSSVGEGHANVTHTVAKGETLYSLAKKYDVSVEAIQAQNEAVLKKGLQVGQVLVIGIAK